MSFALLSAERLLADAISAQIRRHHRRRLCRCGWEYVLDPVGDGWAAGEPPARPGNAIDVLIHGVEALPVIADELAAARSQVHIAGWFFSPDFALVRGERLVVLRNLLAQLAERVAVCVLVRAIDGLWKPISQEQLERRSSGQRLTHRLVRLPHLSKRTWRVLGPLNGLLVDG